MKNGNFHPFKALLNEYRDQFHKRFLLNVYLTFNNSNKIKNIK